jgi:hypothetical protein
MTYEEILEEVKHSQQKMNRHVSVDIFTIDNNKKVVTICKMHDDYHDLELAIIFKKGSFKIEDIAPRMLRTPYSICLQATEPYKNLIGISAFERGVLKKVKEIVKRNIACTHITEMVEASFRALFASLENLDGSLFDTGVSSEQHRQLVMSLPGMSNTCKAFNDDDFDKDLLESARKILAEHKKSL